MLKPFSIALLLALLSIMPAVADSAAQDRPATASPGDAAGVWIDLLELVEDQTEWTLGLGNEFRGAKGELSVVPAPADESAAVAVGEQCMKLAADFTAGGAYIEAARKLDWLEVQGVQAIRLTLRSTNASEFNLRLIDGTGQVHQLKAVPFTADGTWRQVSLDLAKITSGEHWGAPGSANDGQWHGSPKLITLMLTHRADPGKQPEMLIGGVELLGVVPLRVEPTSFREGFEQAMPENWTKQGDVKVVKGRAFEGEHAMQLSRTLQSIDQPTQVVGPAFAASAGQWEVGVATRGSLYSPDNSFHGSVRLECLDASDTVIAGIDIAAQYDNVTWTAHRKRIDLPKGTHAARFRMDLHKTHGTFDIDGLSAAYLAPSSFESQRIARALIRSERLGNLLYPEDKPELSLTIEARRPLPAAQRQVQYTVRDYWGSTQGPARTATLEPNGRGKQKQFLYQTKLDMSGLPIEQGRYYEAHIAIQSDPRNNTDTPFRDHRSFAVLPEAPAKQYDWRRIPFTSRNWDNRMTDYFHLSDRLGLRTAGIWSDWSPTPPYKPAAPGIDVPRKLDMGMVLRSVIFKIEHHRDNWKDYDEQALREGVTNMIKAYGEGDHILITLGNEPPLLEERAEEVVKAYKIVYEQIKAVSPQTTVISTAVGPSEVYFKAGFQHYCDVLDFHTYEEPDGIRKVFESYERLFERYGGRKPIWSTEVGLNSQGMSRLAVASSLIRKFAIFFASGGQNISWFTIMYPDPEGKASGNAFDAHNVFDARYRLYSPRLDAIAYYNMVNSIAIKKCVGETTYEDGTVACLFADDEGRRLQVLWTDEDEHEVMLPLPGVGRVKHIAIDGRITMLDAGGEGITLRVGRHPALLLYEGGEATPASRLLPPAMVLTAAAEHLTKGNSSTFAVSITGADDDVELLAPPQWPVQPRAEQDGVAAFEVGVPEDATAWAAPLSVRLKDEQGRVRGLAQLIIPIKGRVDTHLQPLPMQGGSAGVQLTITNNAPAEQDVRWRVELLGQALMRDGKLDLGNLDQPQAYFTEAAEGAATVAAHQHTRIDLPLAGVDPLAACRARVVIVDQEGRSTVSERWIAGFVGVPRAKGAIQLDGVADEADWARAPLALLTEQRQFQVLKAKEGDAWTGPDDLSAQARYLWDDQYLYIAVEVTDDVHISAIPGKEVWRQDGLQLLVDPSRGAAQPAGKYDYAIGNMPDGPLAQCYLTADPKVSTGAVPEIKVAIAPHGKGPTSGGGDGGGGGRTYELAIPWSRLSPFQPVIGANLGLALAINEDDGPGRYSYLGWFGDLQTKQVDGVGDLILTD